MVESQKPKAKLDMGEAAEFTRPNRVPDSDSSHAGYQVKEVVQGVAGDSAAKVSMSEEPGAGKPLAGICAGVIG